MSEFEKIYHDCFDDVYRYVKRLCGDENIAQEVTSDTFFKAMKSVSKFRGDCDIRIWLYRIAKNCYYTYMKKSNAAAAENDDVFESIPDSGTSVEEKIISVDEADNIRKILHEIPEPYKEVFMWRIFAEMSFSEIGCIFGKSENWACVTYHRARKKIIERMNRD